MVVVHFLSRLLYMETSLSDSRDLGTLKRTGILKGNGDNYRYTWYTVSPRVLPRLRCMLLLIIRVLVRFHIYFARFSRQKKRHHTIILMYSIHPRRNHVLLLYSLHPRRNQMLRDSTAACRTARLSSSKGPLSRRVTCEVLFHW